jgi:hypothetical protein
MEALGLEATAVVGGLKRRRAAGRRLRPRRTRGNGDDVGRRTAHRATRRPRVGDPSSPPGRAERTSASGFRFHESHAQPPPSTSLRRWRRAWEDGGEPALASKGPASTKLTPPPRGDRGGSAGVGDVAWQEVRSTRPRRCPSGTRPDQEVHRNHPAEPTFVWRATRARTCAGTSASGPSTGSVTGAPQTVVSGSTPAHSPSAASGPSPSSPRFDRCLADVQRQQRGRGKLKVTPSGSRGTSPVAMTRLRAR